MLAGLTNVPYPLYGFGSRSADPFNWITDLDPGEGRKDSTDPEHRWESRSS
jgi:hypothetical protein